MRKGFIFSSDSVFAVIIAFSLMIALVSMQQAEKGKEKAFETVAQQARDKAIMGFYYADATSDTPSTSAQYYYCMGFLFYDPAGEEQSTPTSWKKCGEFP